MGGRLIHSFPARRRFTAEVRLFDLFAKGRVRGEWFHLSRKQVSMVKTIHGDSDLRRIWMDA